MIHVYILELILGDLTKHSEETFTVIFIKQSLNSAEFFLPTRLLAFGEFLSEKKYKFPIVCKLMNM